jgi:hypothetical protein
MIVALRIHALVRIAHASWTLSAARLSMCVRRYAGRLWHSWARRRHGAMPVTLLGAVRRPSGDLTTKNNQSRYHENNY